MKCTYKNWNESSKWIEMKNKLDWKTMNWNEEKQNRGDGLYS